MKNKLLLILGILVLSGISVGQTQTILCQQQGGQCFPLNWVCTTPLIKDVFCKSYCPEDYTQAPYMCGYKPEVCCIPIKKCGWCGQSCVEYTPNLICPMITPPEGYSCILKDGKCQVTPPLYGGTCSEECKKRGYSGGNCANPLITRDWEKIEPLVVKIGMPGEFGCIERDESCYCFLGTTTTTTPTTTTIPPKVNKPICDGIGSESEGWYDSVTRELIIYDTCAGCEAKCIDTYVLCTSNQAYCAGGSDLSYSYWYSSCGMKKIIDIPKPYKCPTPTTTTTIPQRDCYESEFKISLLNRNFCIPTTLLDIIVKILNALGREI